MPLTQVDKVFGGPWGIVEHRRKEIEDGHFGKFDKVYAEEVARHFVGIEMAAIEMGCSDSTARKWLERVDARFIAGPHSSLLYYLPDVKRAKSTREQAAKERAAKPKGKAA